jgi:hypothetical protein
MRILGAALAIALSLAGSAACSGDDEPQKVGEADGFTTYAVESSGFSVGVPADWETVSVDDVLTEETLDSMRKADPGLAPVLDVIAAPDSPIKLMAADLDTDAGFATNLNVYVEKAPGFTRGQYFDTAPMQLESLGITEFDEERVGLPAGEALRLAYEHTRFGVDQPLAVVQYAFFENGTGYTLTYTTLPSAVDSRVAEFEQSARSFRIA